MKCNMFERKKIAPFSWTTDQQMVLVILPELMMIVLEVITPMLIILVMVDHLFADEDYSGDDQCSYDDDHSGD